MSTPAPPQWRSLSEELIGDIERAGYYPALVTDVLVTAIGGESVVDHLVHVETTFDRHVRRHITVLAITNSRLVMVHADDHEVPSPAGPPVSQVTASSDAVALRYVRSVLITHVVPDPAHYQPGQLGRDITMTVSWGTVSRLDLAPVSCGDPQCAADHGYEGAVTGDDISLRISADAEGSQVLDRARTFAATLSDVTARAAQA